MERLNRPATDVKLRRTRRTTLWQYGSRVTSNKKKRPVCNICAKILETFQPGNHFHNELGSLEDVILSSTCRKHPRLIASCMTVDWKSRRDTNLYVTRSPDKSGVMIPQVSPTSYAGSDILMVVPRNLEQKRARCGRLVHPRWVDLALVRRWYECCRQTHIACRASVSKASPTLRPTWLIDCWLECLTPGAGEKQYVALSYVWGGEVLSSSRRSIVHDLQRSGAFSKTDVFKHLPLTVRDAMGLTVAMRERYLWVDCLCIVQDDTKNKHNEILNMSAIFARAALTIVSTASNANHGLRGIPNVSVPRDMVQVLVPLRKGLDIVATRQSWRQGQHNVWRTRAWTFQEDVFSRRRLIFNDDTVSWECCEIQWFEDQGGGQKDLAPRHRLLLQNTPSSIFPDTFTLSFALESYNGRNLTYEEDAHNGIAGTLSALGKAFRGGFISGLPALCFDAAVLWLPRRRHTLVRRTGEHQSPQCPEVAPCLFPSWSWIGWKGHVELESWHEAMTYVKWIPSKSCLATQVYLLTVPLVLWYTKMPGKPAHRLDYCDLNYYRTHCVYGDALPPTGWTRHDLSPDEDLRRDWLKCEKQPKYVYRYVSVPLHEFWHPIPVPQPDEEQPAPVLIPWLQCRTRRAYLYAAERYDDPRAGTHLISLRDDSGAWIGALISGCERAHSRAHEVELVEISMGYSVRQPRREPPHWTFLEFRHPERPRSSDPRYEFYNVLWIEWENCIAYRKGLGRMAKERWEALDREWIDLTLG